MKGITLELYRNNICSCYSSAAELEGDDYSNVLHQNDSADYPLIGFETATRENIWK